MGSYSWVGEFTSPRTKAKEEVPWGKFEGGSRGRQKGACEWRDLNCIERSLWGNFSQALGLGWGQGMVGRD